MKIVKLTREHVLSSHDLFGVSKYMGVNIGEHHMGGIDDIAIQNQILLGRFTDTYLSGLKSFHAFGAYADDDEGLKKMLGFIAFHEDAHEPSWHMTMSRNNGDREVIRSLLDKAIEYNEKNGRLKFYTLMNAKHAKVIRKFGWSDYNTERYDFVDEYVVPAKTRCLYYTAWEVLFKRALLPVDTIVRCSFLKQEYRETLVSGGGIINAAEQLPKEDTIPQEEQIQESIV